MMNPFRSRLIKTRVVGSRFTNKAGFTASDVCITIVIPSILYQFAKRAAGLALISFWEAVIAFLVNWLCKDVP